MNTTTPVDVLAVLDWMMAASARDRREFPIGEGDELMLAQEREARAAVVELMEAAKIGRFYLADVAADPFHVDQEAARLHLQQVDAAIARCGGGK